MSPRKEIRRPTPEEEEKLRKPYYSQIRKEEYDAVEEDLLNHGSTIVVFEGDEAKKEAERTSTVISCRLRTKGRIVTRRISRNEDGTVNLGMMLLEKRINFRL